MSNLYLEVILSEYVYYMPNTVWYILNKDNQNLYLNDLIGKIAKVPFGKKELEGLIINISDKIPDGIEKEKIKEIIDILPNEFSLDKKFIDFIKEISRYYFSTLSQTVSLFLPKKIFSPSEKEIKKINNNSNIKNTNNTFQKSNLHTLNPEQEKVLKDIFDNDNILIHGITGSGKTEIYKHAILEVIKKGRQACLTVPEIALTPQLLNYFKDLDPSTSSGGQIAVIHSKITPVQKAKIWHGVKSGEIKLIIGSRSSLFMPWKDLGIVCIDEEHEWTYKNEQSPRYRLSFCAEMICKSFGAKLVLGSATPDICDYFNFSNGEGKLSKIFTRSNGKPLPKIEVIDLKEELRKKNKSPISEKLQFEIKKTLEKGEQVILFLNQRGLSSALVCTECGEVIKCDSCSVSMTFHKKGNKEKLICHYCGKIENPPESCPRCKSLSLKTIGFGTQKIEEEVKKLFPNAKAYRADADTTKTKLDFENLNDDLKSEDKVDILIGTQMIAKGFDLPRVSLVGVISADTSLFIPDFRSSEKTFQLLVQVAGRAGRGEKEAKVFIQTFKPDHPAIIYASKYDYTSFYNEEIEARKLLKLPPFSNVIKFSLRDKNLKILQEKIKEFLFEIEKINKEDSLDLIIRNAPNSIPKIANEFIWNIVVRGEIEKLFEKLDLIKLREWRIDRDPNMLS